MKTRGKFIAIAFSILIVIALGIGNGCTRGQPQRYRGAVEEITLGAYAGDANTTGSYITGVGYGALGANTTATASVINTFPVSTILFTPISNANMINNTPELIFNTYFSLEYPTTRNVIPKRNPNI